MSGFSEKLRDVVEAVLHGEGESEPALRRAVHAHAATLAGQAAGEGGELPESLRSYVEKVAKHAYKTTDEDIEALKRAGYSEEAIFEITLATAVGAGTARLERGLAALEERSRR